MSTSSTSDPRDARAWKVLLSGYREPAEVRSALELVVTALPLFGLWALAIALLKAGHHLGLLCVVPAAGFLVRLFLIQHDCGHGSLFRSRAVNDWVGRVIGVITFTPYEYWRRTHAIHHATSGNLDRRELGAVEMLTVAEYLALPRLRRWLYRLYRHPLVLFGLGPAYMFILQHRAPIGLMRAGWWPWASVMGTNLSLAILLTAGALAVGAAPLLWVIGLTVTLAATTGVWLFYVQHQFERTRWSRRDEWDVHEAALHGSSYYDLPPVLRWFTANIGVHHVHHLNSRIPFYRMPQILRDHAELEAFGRMTLRESLACVPLVLWREESGELVSFRALKRMAKAPERARLGQRPTSAPGANPPSRSVDAPVV